MRDWPNICAPVAGVIDHYRRKGLDIECSWVDDGSFLAHTNTHSPLIVRDYFDTSRLARPFGIVWKYNDSDEVKALVDAVIREVLTKEIIEKGVSQGVEWCLNETMDNVLQHSQATYGYFMGTFTSSDKRLSICVFDNGVGIYNSLKNSKHLPASPLDAITLALKEGVTRDESVGQGNGMWGLSEIVQNNDGQYVVASSGASYSIINGRNQTNEQRSGVFYANEQRGAVLVDFQLNCSKQIDIVKALHGHSPTQLWLEDLETPEGDDYVIRIAERSEGTGTRKAGARIRNLAMNVLKEGNKRIVLDFSGINLVSSSYADELIGKLVAEIGFSIFNTFFLISGLSDLNRRVVDRSVQQRMAQIYYDTIVPEGD